MGVLIFLACVVALVIYAFAASEFRRIAQMKGHDESRYFWWSFLLGPVGWLMVIALPDHSATGNGNKTPLDDELPDL